MTATDVTGWIIVGLLVFASSYIFLSHGNRKRDD